MFLVNSRLSLFTAAPTSLGSLLEVHHQSEHPFFRSYGANWSSSLRRVLPSALESSSHPPVSVYGTVTCSLTRGFSWRYGIRQSVSSEEFTSHRASEFRSPDLPRLPPARLDRNDRRPAVLSSRVTPSLKQKQGGTGIFVPVSHRLRPSASA